MGRPHGDPPFKVSPTEQPLAPRAIRRPTAAGTRADSKKPPTSSAQALIPQRQERLPQPPVAGLLAHTSSPGGRLETTPFAHRRQEPRRSSRVQPQVHRRPPPGKALRPCDRMQPAQGTNPERQRLACRSMAGGRWCAGSRLWSPSLAARRQHGRGWGRRSPQCPSRGSTLHRSLPCPRRRPPPPRRPPLLRRVAPRHFVGVSKEGGRCRYRIRTNCRYQRRRCDLSYRGSPAPCRHDGRRNPWATRRPKGSPWQLPRRRARADRPRSRGHSNDWACHQRRVYRPQRAGNGMKAAAHAHTVASLEVVLPGGAGTPVVVSNFGPLDTACGLWESQLGARIPPQGTCRHLLRGRSARFAPGSASPPRCARSGQAELGPDRVLVGRYGRCCAHRAVEGRAWGASRPGLGQLSGITVWGSALGTAWSPWSW